MDQDTNSPIEKHFNIIQEQKNLIKMLEEQIQKAKEIKDNSIKELEKYVNDNKETYVRQPLKSPLVGDPAKIQLRRTNQRMDWNEEKLKEACPENLRNLIFVPTRKFNPKEAANHEKRLMEVCPEDLRDLIFVPIIEFKLKMVKALHEQDQLPKDLLDNCLTITPATLNAKYED